MSHHQQPPEGPTYSVDEILAEFGSGKYSKPKEPTEPTPSKTPGDVPPSQKPGPSAPPKEPNRESKVVPFPQAQKAPQPNPAPPQPVAPAKSSGPKRLAPSKPKGKAHREEPSVAGEILPNSPFRHLGARLSTLQRKADHFADHMYDQAEPDQETVKAEKYIPGVDREETPRPKAPRFTLPAPRHKPKRHIPLPPDTPPDQLAAQYQKGLKGMRGRLTGALLLAIVAVVLSMDLPITLSVGVTLFQIQSWSLTLALALVGVLCREILVTGATSLTRGKPGCETILTLAWIFTLLDGLTAGALEERQGCLPCAAVTALGLVFALWGIYMRRQGDRLSAKTAAQSSTPYVVTLDENKWNARPAYTKWTGTPQGFGSQLQMEDGGQKLYRVITPILLIACLILSALASLGTKHPGRFVWAISTSLTVSASYCALLAYGLPYRKVARRLYRSGAALAGWAGISRCRHSGIVMTDQDLFPQGYVQVTQVQIVGGASKEKAVGYTATLLRAMGSGLTRPFQDLVRTSGSIFYREVTGVRFHEGGASGIIRNHEVLVGTSDFMHLMDVPLPRGMNIKHAIFCSIDGKLSGMFPINYTLAPAIRPSLRSLMGNRVSPILATRDPNLIPALLDQKFKLPVDKMDFPSVERRWELSQPQQEHTMGPVAVLNREGLGIYSEAVVGSRRLRRATRLGLGFALAGTVLGLVLTFYLAWVGAYGSLTPVNFLLYMLLWLVPQLLVAGWVNQY